jgi:hypothetical protein
LTVVGGGTYVIRLPPGPQAIASSRASMAAKIPIMVLLQEWLNIIDKRLALVTNHFQATNGIETIFAMKKKG